MVDDDFYITEMLGEVLGDQGYSIDVARSARALEQALEEKAPDLIILDIALPGMDGTEIGHLLHTSPATALIPVLMLSADREIERKATRSNIENWLPKPVDINLLLDKIDAMLESKAA